jgi:hypothetical protein
MQQDALLPRGETAWLVLLVYSLCSGLVLWLARVPCARGELQGLQP